MVETFVHEADKFDLPEETEQFEITVDECVVHPVFIKKPDLLRIEYDFTLCNTQVRTLSLSMFKGTGRIELTLKNQTEIQENI